MFEELHARARIGSSRCRLIYLLQIFFEFTLLDLMKTAAVKIAPKYLADCPNFSLLTLIVAPKFILQGPKLAQAIFIAQVKSRFTLKLDSAKSSTWNLRSLSHFRI